MESNRKRRGFMKGKLMPLYRAAKPPSTLPYSSKVIKPSQSAAASLGFVVHHQDYLIAQPKQKVSIVLQADNNRDKISHFDNLFGDEMVDSKAASYISSVQERFKLERSNSERTKSQDGKALETANYSI